MYSSMFSESRRDFEDSMFWFQDGVHWPNVLTPWDATFFEFAIASLSQYNAVTCGCRSQWHRVPNPERIWIFVAGAGR